MGDGNGVEDGGWGEHGRKVEGVGVDAEEAGNESYCLFVTENDWRLIFKAQFVLILLKLSGCHSCVAQPFQTNNVQCVCVCVCVHLGVGSSAIHPE